MIEVTHEVKTLDLAFECDKCYATICVPRMPIDMRAKRQPIICYGCKTKYFMCVTVTWAAARSVYAKCTDTKTSDGDSCGPRVPCDGILYDIETGDGDGGCGEPCTFVMHPEQYRIKD